MPAHQSDSDGASGGVICGKNRSATSLKPFSGVNVVIIQLARGLTDAPNGSQIFDDQTAFSSDEDAFSATFG